MLRPAHLCPVDFLEEAAPVLALLHPDLLLHAVAKLAAAGSLPQRIDRLQVLLWDELHLCSKQARPHINGIHDSVVIYLFAGTAITIEQHDQASGWVTNYMHAASAKMQLCLCTIASARLQRLQIMLALV